jgi:hypothetical protein
MEQGAHGARNELDEDKKKSVTQKRSLCVDVQQLLFVLIFSSLTH